MDKPTGNRAWTTVDAVWEYDGSYDGLLTCVFAAYEGRRMPVDVSVRNDTLLPSVPVATDAERAARVKRAIPRVLGTEAVRLVTYTFLSDLPHKEAAILRFLRLGFTVGRGVCGRLADADVALLQRTAKNVGNETHRYLQFVRFTDVGGALASVIEPKNFVLPLLTRHFVARYPQENFLIYDKTHGAALIHADGNHAILPVLQYELPEPDEQEQRYRALWQLFYDTVEVKPRHNERCRMNHMPKRYWANMTEFCR